MEEYIELEKTKPGYLVPFGKEEQAKMIAELFCGLSSLHQAMFFDRIAEIDKKYWGNAAIFQWRSMQESLTEKARQVIVDIYEHTSEEEQQ